MDLLAAIEDHTENLNDIERDDTYELGDKLAKSFSRYKKPSISYKFLNIRTVPDFCLNNSTIDKIDFDLYFQRIKEVCSTTYHDLITNSNQHLGFQIYSSPNSKLWEQFKKIVGDRSLTPEQKPAFGRIALYNSSPANNKAPRIFFFVGHNCTLHIFLFDTYHQIYPGT